jgi:protein-disulfide isomerase
MQKSFLNNTFAKLISTAFLVVGTSTLVGAQIPAPVNSQPPAAIVSGQQISYEELVSAASPQLRPLDMQEYQIKKEVLESLVNQKLLEAEAHKRGVSVDELIDKDVDAKVAEPSDLEVKAFYLGQKDRLNRPLSDIEPQLRTALYQVRIQQARQDYFKSLRESAGIAILLRPPKMDVKADPGRLRGKPDAPVSIVEFSDFQCPYCQQVEPTLKQLLVKYDGRVSLGYRDFPLPMHPQAQLAAEASRCAAEQGKFWEYHDLLYANPSMLLEPGLIENARKLGLDEKDFSSCLKSGKFRNQVQSDSQEGEKAGVKGTPAFFINGIFLSGNEHIAEFSRIIDEELAEAALKPSHQ